MRPPTSRQCADHEDVQHARQRGTVSTFREPSVGFDFDAVERGVFGEASEDTDPDEKPRRKPGNAPAPASSDARLVHMMTRILAWQLFGRKADKIVRPAVLKRTIVTAYAINPAFFDGKSLNALATMLGCEREALYAVAREFTREFGIPVHGSSAERRRLKARKKAKIETQSDFDLFDGGPN